MTDLIGSSFGAATSSNPTCHACGGSGLVQWRVYGVYYEWRLCGWCNGRGVRETFSSEADERARDGLTFEYRELDRRSPK